MNKEIPVMKEGDWSLSLEDPYFESHIEEIFTESLAAVQRTKSGHYVNLVTPGACGDPRVWMFSQLLSQLQKAGLSVQDIRYMNQCGCGGHVTRVFR